MSTNFLSIWPSDRADAYGSKGIGFYVPTDPANPDVNQAKVYVVPFMKTTCCISRGMPNVCLR